MDGVVVLVDTGELVVVDAADVVVVVGMSSSPSTTSVAWASLSVLEALVSVFEDGTLNTLVSVFGSDGDGATNATFFRYPPGPETIAAVTTMGCPV